MRNIIEYSLLFLLLSCTQSQTKNIEQELILEKRNTKQQKFDDVEFKFDCSVISGNLIEFINNNLDSLRIPTEKDFELEYLMNRNDNQLPFYCSGLFNEDLKEDYAIVLIDDSTNHYVFSFHSMNNSFEIYLLSSSKYSTEKNSKKKSVIYELATEIKKELEAIDTTYILKTNAISITNIYESRTKVHVWNSLNNKYDVLLFA